MKRTSIARRTLIALVALLLVPALAGAAPYKVPNDGKIHVLPEGIGAIDPTNPAATAPAVPADTTWVFNGSPISPNDAAAKNLACLEDDGPTTRCYRSEKALDAAENVTSLAASIARHGRKGRRHAHASNHAYGPMQTWESAGPSGWLLQLNSQGGWYDLTGSYNNAASYLYTGNHTGYWSVGNQGAGGQVWGGAYVSADLTVGIQSIYNNVLSSRHRPVG